MNRLIFTSIQTGFITAAILLMNFIFINTVLAFEFKRPSGGKPKKYVTTPIPKLPTRKITYKEYVVPSILSWNEAKKHGFKFYPEGAKGVKDGKKVWGVSYYRDKNNRLQQAPNTSRLSAGILLEMGTLVSTDFSDLAHLGSIDSYAIFHYFAGKKLKANWKVKSISFGGNYKITKRPQGRTAHTKIKLSVKGRGLLPSENNAFANFKEIILIGPSSGKWQDAFDVR